MHQPKPLLIVPREKVKFCAGTSAKRKSSPQVRRTDVEMDVAMRRPNRGRISIPALCLLAAGFGGLLGMGAFTFQYAEGTSYLSNNPQACVRRDDRQRVVENVDRTETPESKMDVLLHECVVRARHGDSDSLRTLNSLL